MNNSTLAFFRNIYRITDIFLLFPALYLAGQLRFGHFSFDKDTQLLYLISLVVWYGATKLSDFYSRSPWHEPLERVRKYGKTILLFVILLPVSGYLFRGMPYSRLVFFYTALFQLLLILAVHPLLNRLLHHFRHTDHSARRTLIVGAGTLGREVGREILLHRELGITLAGYADDKKTGHDILGPTDKIPELIREYRIQEIILALPFHYNAVINRLVSKLDQIGVRVHFALDYARWYSFPVSLRIFGTMPLLTVRDFPLDLIGNRCKKRSIDILLSAGALLFLLPLWGIIALLIKVTSPGPVFFVQERTGYNQKSFMCYKFRSMSAGSRSDADSQQAQARDPRITPLGAFMRKYNIDELPQLINVLRGEMSLVGPRPHMLAHTAEFRSRIPEYMARHFVRPGITGWAQVNGWRGPTDTDEKLSKRVEFDLDYLENWSIWLDLKIMWMTLGSRAPEVE
ncbi:MAG: undecaprenyl-phosphate glucose phosphotransferase [Fibrobacterota bacterium]